MIDNGIVHTCDFLPTIVGSAAGEVRGEQDICPFPRAQHQWVITLHRFNGKGIDRGTRQTARSHCLGQGFLVDYLTAAPNTRIEPGFMVESTAASSEPRV